MTVRARASLRAARRSSRLWKRMGWVVAVVAAAAAGGGVCVIAYGSGRAWIAPGVSTVVESASVQPSGRQPCGTMKAAAAQVADGLDVLALGQAVREFHQRALGVAEQQQVGLRVRQDRAPHLVRPVVVMRDAAQARLDAADDQRRIGIGLAAALGVDDDRVVGALVRRGVRRVGVGGTDFPVGGIAVDHRIHVAGGDAEEQVRLCPAA